MSGRENKIHISGAIFYGVWARGAICMIFFCGHIFLRISGVFFLQKLLFGADAAFEVFLIWSFSKTE